MLIGRKYPQGAVSADVWEKVYENYVTVATTQVSITGLDGDSAEMYLFDFRFCNTLTDGNSCRMRFNNVSNTDYNTQTTYGDGSTANATNNSRTYMLIGTHAATQSVVHVQLLVYARVHSSDARMTIGFNMEDVTGTTIDRVNHMSHSYYGLGAGTNLTSVQLYSDDTNGIGPNSHFIIYRRITV